MYHKCKDFFVAYFRHLEHLHKRSYRSSLLLEIEEHSSAALSYWVAHAWSNCLLVRGTHPHLGA